MRFWERENAGRFLVLKMGFEVFRFFTVCYRKHE